MADRVMFDLDERIDRAARDCWNSRVQPGGRPWDQLHPTDPRRAAFRRDAEVACRGFAPELFTDPPTMIMSRVSAALAAGTVSINEERAARGLPPIGEGA